MQWVMQIFGVSRNPKTRREPKPGIEPGTCRLRGDRSGRLSYKGVNGSTAEPSPGFEPGTFGCIRCSIHLSYWDLQCNPCRDLNPDIRNADAFPLKLQGRVIIVEPPIMA